MIAIILVNYNGYKDTIECIQELSKSIADMNEKVNVIVVDNHSTDDSYNKFIIQSRKLNFIFLEEDNNLGFSGGNNIGIKYAIDHGADYILLINNDTITTPSFLSRLLSTYKSISDIQHTDKIVLSPKINYYYDKNKIWFCGGTWNRYTGRTTHIGINEDDTGQYKNPFSVSFLSGCCMLIPVKAIKEVGFMSEEYFLYCEDTDYCLRLMNAGYQLWVDPGSIIYHKVSASTGKVSDAYTYYSVRNKQYLIDKYIKRGFWPLARLYSKIEIFNKIRKSEYNKDIVSKALLDYRNRVKGRI